MTLISVFRPLFGRNDRKNKFFCYICSDKERLGKGCRLPVPAVPMRNELKYQKHMKKFLKTSLLLICASLSLLSCKDDENDAPEITVRLDKTELALTIGETSSLTALVTPPLETIGQSVVWSSDNEAVATVSEGTVTAVAVGQATVTATVGEKSATCVVTVSPIVVRSVTLDEHAITLEVEGTQTLTATVLPDDATDPTVTWTSNDETIATVEAGVVTAVAAGTTVIRAVAGDAADSCVVTVVVPEPKIGDYFYSDGTWSDGGLVSIEADGLNPVWADVKPAPKAGKTVIGIVFQTFGDRIAETDKEAGYTHGYVVAVKSAHGTEKQTTWWSSDFGFSALKGAKLASTWYKNVNGRAETTKVGEVYSERMDLMPAFKWTLNGFTFAAPETTSGWFLPSTGQLWDMMANLCGNGVAAYMKEWQALDKDATWYCSEKTDYDVIAQFNSTMSEIPAEDKEELFVTEKYYTTCSLWASTPYADETSCVMNIGTNGTIECMTEYFDYDAVARPILAF